jgi:hypothetical protein
MSTQQGDPAEPTGAGQGTSSESTSSESTASHGDTGSPGPEGSQETPGEGTSPREYLRGWFTGRLPSGWFTAAPSIEADREEITVVGALPDPETEAGASEAERAAAAEGRMRRFREETRARRVEIAREAEHRFRRKVSWGVTCGGQTEMYTTLSVPVMTRLRQPERRVLDTLVEAGVARSRSDALAWCVRLVGQHEDTWLAELRSALRRVEEVRSEGPKS